jgi:hypothetical protein
VTDWQALFWQLLAFSSVLRIPAFHIQMPQEFVARVAKRRHFRDCGPAGQHTRHLVFSLKKPMSVSKVPKLYDELFDWMDRGPLVEALIATL